MSTRREFITTAAALGARALGAQTDKARPNILLLFPDQHRFDWTGFNRNLSVRTPHLDRLAQRSVRFTNAVVASPLCAPSRACLASGKEYEHCRVRDNRENYPVHQKSCYTLLRENGYHTAACGKIDLHKASSNWGLDGKHLLPEWGFLRWNRQCRQNGRHRQRSDVAVRTDILPILATRYKIVEPRPMWRMTLRPEEYQGASSSDVVRLSSSERSAVQQLYADGNTSGESPDFFAPSMLDDGVFYGLWENGQLAAVAGTHLVVPSEEVAAVGNIYTRRDRRGRGLAASVTSAVVDELLRMRIRTIVLNVNQSNTAAIRVYERLGFRRHCSYYEGLAESR